MKKIYRYIRSPSTIFALCIGGIMYLSYAYANQKWGNIALILVTLFIATFLPTYSKMSNKIEEKTNLRFALITMGRLSRFGTQFLFNLAIFGAFVAGGVLDPANLTGIGGVLGAAIVTTLASQGAQYIAIVAFNRNIGDLNRNVLVGLSANIVVTALATAGVAAVKPGFVVLGIGIGALVFGVGILSDLRAYLYPKQGIGIFFGTFNPFHATHLAIVRRALEERGLAKVIVHPTIVPKLHARALERGEIRVARIEAGLCIYEKTERADSNVNYFPTGNRFFPPETRKLLIELAIAEAGLSDRVEVACYPDIYREEGFYGVIREIRRHNPGLPIHGLHGSDLGGMWVRNIYDECGWIYPMAVRRTDGVSATAIRNGAVGMTTRIVREMLGHLRHGSSRFEIDNQGFRNENGIVTYA
jgi:hypothetical protein